MNLEPLSLLDLFSEQYEGLPAERFDRLDDFYSFIEILMTEGLSFRVKLIKNKKEKRSQIMVILIENFDNYIENIIEFTTSLTCPNCSEFVNDDYWCQNCGYINWMDISGTRH